MGQGKKMLRWFLAALGMVLLYVLINTLFIAKDYIYGPPLLFLQSRYLAVDIYPRGCQSATVFTNNYIEGKTTVEDIAILRLFLKKRGIRGVFFIIPNYRGQYPIDRSEEVLKEIRELAADGHEIAQAGTFHTFPDDRKNGDAAGHELVNLHFEDQLERVKQGKDLLVRSGFPTAGFRAPDFETNRDTFRVLETADYLYSSSSALPPRTWNTLLRPPLTVGALYPYHPSGFDILEFSSSVDPTRNFSKSARLFRRVHALNGVFVFHTYIGNVAERDNIKTLDQFLELVQGKNTWIAPLEEISRWWLAREKLRVETQRKGELLAVTITNHSPYPLAELGIKIFKHPLESKRFSIRDGDGTVLAEGALPAREKVFVNIPPSPSSAR